MDKIFYGSVDRAFTLDLLPNDGDFLLRRARSGGTALSVNHNNVITHWLFGNGPTVSEVLIGGGIGEKMF